MIDEDCPFKMSDSKVDNKLREEEDLDDLEDRSDLEESE